MAQETAGLLDGIRILDFTCNAAGPYAVWLLGSLGAEIAKVESHSRPDPTRGLADRPYAHSVFFEDINGGKRCIDLDLKTREGVETALELAGSCHAVVDSFRPGVMDRLGLGAEAILARNPGAVVASLSATGSQGPYAGLPGYAGIFNALGGLGGLTGYEGGPPTELRTSIDLRSGALFSSLIAFALLDAAKTGKGRHLDFSAVEAVSLLAGEHVAAALLGGGPVPERIGNRDELWQAQGVFATSDARWVAVTVRDAGEWDRLETEVGESLRTRDHSALVALAAGRSGDDLAEVFRRAGIAAEIVLDASQVSADPHLHERDFFQQVEGVAGVGRQTVAAAPWIVDGVRPPVLPGQELGAETEAIVAEWAAPPHRSSASDSADATTHAGPLRVLELGAGAAVPFAGHMLASLGADVVKVEIAPQGDWTRRRPPLVDVDGVRAGALFHFLNAGKRSRSVTDEGLDPALEELWGWADAVVVDETFLSHEAVASRLGSAGPRVVTTVTPFGLSGPDSGRPATAATLFARCGEGSITPGGLGHQLFPAEPPLVARGKLSELDSGVTATLLTTAALHSGTGSAAPRLVEISSYEVEVSVNCWIPGNFARTGWIESREARPYPYGGLLPCKDGHAMFLPSTNGHWAGFVEIMGHPEWALDEELSTYAGRAHNAARVRVGIIEWASTKTTAELFELGLRHGVPIGPYRSAEEVAACPHLHHRGFFVPYGADGDHLLPGVPAPGMARRTPLAAAPALFSPLPA